MGKRTLQIIGALSLAVCLALLVLRLFRGRETDEAVYHDMEHTKRVFGLVMSADRSFLGPVVRRLELWEHYTKHFDSQCEKLLATGYLTNASIEVANAKSRRGQVVGQLEASVKGTDILICKVLWASNSVTVTCRPQDVPRIREGLAK
jgi:hypothetical protein